MLQIDIGPAAVTMNTTNIFFWSAAACASRALLSSPGTLPFFYSADMPPRKRPAAAATVGEEPESEPRRRRSATAVTVSESADDDDNDDSSSGRPSSFGAGSCDSDAILCRERNRSRAGSDHGPPYGPPPPEPVHDDRSAGVAGGDHLTPPPRRLPPPRPRPVSALRPWSHLVSRAVANALQGELGFEGQILAHVPWNMDALQNVTVIVQGMTAREMRHPNALVCRTCPPECGSEPEAAEVADGDGESEMRMDEDASSGICTEEIEDFLRSPSEGARPDT